MNSKEHFFWGTKDLHYKDGHSIPRVTYRCKKTATKEGSSKWTTRKHECKLVTDHHPHKCICICGLEFGGTQNV